MRVSIKRIVLAAIPVAIAVVAVAASLAATVAPLPGPGYHLAFEGGQVVVAAVDPGSTSAQSYGFRVGDVVVQLDDRYVLDLPDDVKRDLAGSELAYSYVSTTTRDNVGAVSMARLEENANDRILALLCPLTATGCQPVVPFDPIYDPISGAMSFMAQPPLDPAPLLVGLAIFLTGWWWIGSGRAGANLRPFALSLPLATAVPVLALPIDRYPAGYATVAGAALVALAMLPLAIDFTVRIERPRLRYLVGSIAAALAAAAVLVGMPGSSSSNFPVVDYPIASWYLASIFVLVPILLLPVALAYLLRTEHGTRRLLIAGSGLVLAVGTMWFADAVRGSVGYRLPYLLGIGAPAGLMTLGDFIANGYVFAPLAMLPLLIVSLRRVAVTEGRWFAAIVMIALMTGLAIAVVDGYGGTRLWRALLAGSVAFLPGLVLARPFGRREGPVQTGSPTRALFASVDILIAAVTPGIACIGLVFSYDMPVWPILAWLLLLFLATRLTLRPLTRMLSNATLQRDMVVAATESERARIAANIHDDALQDLTMLVRRLDAAGDTANAQAAREIAERLRAICGDLRLPVLDDLGVGPALEWLCGRLEANHDSIELDREGDESRLPAEVELAVFRVAQEALSNAIRHGAPPILVRYRASDGRAELEVRDSGDGLPDGAAELAQKTGHLGLMNMTQRAEAIGAELKIVSDAGGGTRVLLVWDEGAAEASRAEGTAAAAAAATAVQPA